MSKENNLKDYLTDLYQGLVSKKPNASKNPQDFRREIESIVTGTDVPEWGGGSTIEGEDGETVGTEGLEYVLSSDGTYYLCKGIGTATETDIVIAGKYNGLPVLSCADKAFDNNKSITSVTLGNRMTSVGYKAFSYCTSLKRVTIPNSVQVISEYAFKGCSKLTGVTLPNSVTQLISFAFSDCTDLKSIIIPNSVTSIGNYAFSNCPRLTDVYYKGSESEWDNKLDLGPYGNDSILNATIHYNS